MSEHIFKQRNITPASLSEPLVCSTEKCHFLPQNQIPAYIGFGAHNLLMTTCISGPQYIPVKLYISSSRFPPEVYFQYIRHRSVTARQVSEIVLRRIPHPILAAQYTSNRSRFTGAALLLAAPRPKIIHYLAMRPSHRRPIPNLMPSENIGPCRCSHK